jgi:hypothetical protein
VMGTSNTVGRGQVHRSWLWLQIPLPSSCHGPLQRTHNSLTFCRGFSRGNLHPEFPGMPGRQFQFLALDPDSVPHWV